jgi:hypothetical protein
MAVDGEGVVIMNKDGAAKCLLVVGKHFGFGA